MTLLRSTGATRKRDWLETMSSMIPGLFGVAEHQFALMYNFNNYFSGQGLSADAQYDGGGANHLRYRVGKFCRAILKFHRPPFRKQFCHGVPHLTGQAVMPVFLYQCRRRSEPDIPAVVTYERVLHQIPGSQDLSAICFCTWGNRLNRLKTPTI